MKKLLGMLALAATAACQPQNTTPPATAGRPTVPPAVPVAKKTAAPTKPVPAPLNALSDKFLRSFDLTPVLSLVDDGTGQGETPHLNGFYGPDRYRMELVLTSVRRDPDHPNRYLVAGKDRYKKIITPLTGVIDFTDVRLYPIDTAAHQSRVIRPYTVLGSYELREDPAAHGAGVFRGRIAADMGLNMEDQARYVPAYDTPSKGGGLTLTGNWTSLATGQQKDATWVLNLFEYQGPQVARDFLLGERDPDINPKYAKYGWNNYWENDEWWVDSPGAVASRK